MIDSSVRILLFHMYSRPMLLHGMTLVSFRLFRKNLDNLREVFGQMVHPLPSPLAKNCPYSYGAYRQCNNNNVQWYTVTVTTTTIGPM